MGGLHFARGAAAPEETAIPSSSKVMTAVSAFMPSTPNNVVFGRRPAASPKMTACGEIALRPDSNRLRNASMCAASAAKWRCAAAAAAPKAAIPTTFFGAGAQAALVAAAADQRLRKWISSFGG
jgi:hypothetical protein